jgi:MoaA/NifB/PqqE/SkfB family radical SAM enzyme
MKKIEYDIYKKIYKDGKNKCERTTSGLPTQIALEITRNCNLSCEYCPRETYPFLRDKLNMTVGIVHDLKDVWQVAESVIFCGGGEPYLHKNIYGILEYIRKYNDSTIIGVVTNGTIPLNERDVSRLNELKVNLVFSVDSMDSYTKTKRKGSNVTNIVKNIRNIHRIKKENNYEYPPIVIVSMLTVDGIDELPGVLDFAMEMDAVSYHVEKINPIWNDNCEEQRIDVHDPDKVVKLFETLHKNAENSNTSIEGKLSYQYGKSSEMANIINNLEKGPCLDPWIFAVISANGMVLPCPNYQYPFNHGVVRGGRTDEQILNQFFQGIEFTEKLLDIGTISEFWNTENYKKLRRSHMIGQPSFACQNCRRIFEHNSWFKCT